MVNVPGSTEVIVRIFPCVVAASLSFLLSAEASRAECQAPPTDGTGPVRAIRTPLGSLRIRLFQAQAPVSVANFLAYADAGDYDGSFFHRLIPNQVIQGGGFSFDPVEKYGEVPERDPIVRELGICNAPGTIAMARPLGQGLDSARNEFFINITDHSVAFGQESNGYAVFGQVFAEDMPVLAALNALHREFGTLLINDPIAWRGLEDETFANVPVLQVPPRPPEGWGCVGGIEPDPQLVTIPGFPIPIWLPLIEDNCGGDPVAEENARALMRADLGPKIDAQLVMINVPEPGAAAPAGAVLTLLWLARSRRELGPRRSAIRSQA